MFAAGQRWYSEAEPELGLGTVARLEHGRVVVLFPGAGEQRQYAADSAPLRRLRLRPGERVEAEDGTSFVIARIEERDARFVYHGDDGRSLPEARLGDAVGARSPLDRLLGGQVDPGPVFELRRAALEHRHRRRQSPVRGFVGGRMDLIPHQLYIAREVTGRMAPRVLLADEVGLGKTIEACLVVHRLLAIGRVARVLILVPEPLVHQWFVELLRRFNLWFSIYDEERCAAVEAAAPDANPFLDEQLVLAALPLILDPRRATQAAAAGWDLLVVDEAHHLRWSPAAPSPEYRVVEAVSRGAEGLLLLTATPEQLGLTGHFARLRLLDPDRYPDLARFEAEAAHYAEAAGLAARLLSGVPVSAVDRTLWERVLGGDPEPVRQRLTRLARGDAGARDELIGDLLDRHGPGRVMFRNTRAAMKDFPRRRPEPAALRAPAGDPGLRDRLAIEFEADLSAGTASGSRGTSTAVRVDYSADPRIVWLADLLRRLEGAKVLLICRRKEKVLAIDAALRARVAVPTALFHEDLELVQRDRNAAWFADPEGARILLASEIGSEGRNFQFAQHLVLFDLPLDPELVEQRIGRLDRIGQKADIRIHVPYVVDSPQEVLLRWFHEGLEALGRSLHAGRELLERFGAEVRDLAMDFHETHETRRAELDDLVERTRVAREEIERRLEQGRDRLLELNSYRPAPAREITEGVSALDREGDLEAFLLRVWDHYGVPVEDLGPRTYRIGADGVYAGSFPGLPAEGLTVTLDRGRALAREDVAFLSWDHPMVTGALDLLLGGKEGTSACAAWPAAPRPGLWLELVHVLECVAPPRLHSDRFLPATPIRVILDVRGTEVTAAAETALARVRLAEGAVHDWLEAESVREAVPRLVELGEQRAREKATPVVTAAVAALDHQLGRELERLRALAAVNPNIRPEEIAATEAQRDDLRRHLGAARLRLDSVRLIVLGEF
jgi:ATP-dependent helicase HepA